MDSTLRKAVDARDRRYTDAKHLNLLRRNEGVVRRLCSFCWRIQDDHPQRPAMMCSDCGGALDEITL